MTASYYNFPLSTTTTAYSGGTSWQGYYSISNASTAAYQPTGTAYIPWFGYSDPPRRMMRSVAENIREKLRELDKKKV